MQSKLIPCRDGGAGGFCQKLPSNDNNNMGYSLLNPFFDATQNKLSND